MFDWPGWGEIGRDERAHIERKIFANVEASREGFTTRMAAPAETVGDGLAALNLFGAAFDLKVRHRCTARMLCV